MGRLAITQKNAIDEMFEPFFEELAVVGKDPRLNAVIYRTVIALGIRSKYLNEQSVELAKTFQLCEQENAMKLGEILLDELTTESISFDGSE